MTQFSFSCAIGAATLTACGLLVGCTPKARDKEIEVGVYWLTDKAPGQQESESFRNEASEWYTPFRAGPPCSARFYFKVTLFRTEGPSVIKTELFTQKPSDISDRIGGFQSKIGFKPAFKEIQAAAKADVVKDIPGEIFTPKAQVESSLGAVEELRERSKPELIFYRNIPAPTSTNASDSSKTRTANEPQAFQAEIQRAFCSMSEANLNSKAAKASTPQSNIFSVLLIDLKEQPIVPKPSFAASAAPQAAIAASAPSSAPSPAVVAASSPSAVTSAPQLSPPALPPTAVIAAPASSPAPPPPIVRKPEKTVDRKPVPASAQPPTAQQMTPERKPTEDLHTTPPPDIRQLPKSEGKK